MMKRFLTIMMALAIVAALSRCRKPDVEAVDSTAKVRISCTIPVNKDGKTDFTSEGNVNWSAGVESIYLAIPDETEPQIVELKSELQDKSKPTLTFTGSVQAGLLTDGNYDVWYFGNSKHSGKSYIKENKTNDVITSINGDISEQSGNLSDLGGCHIAKATVTANGNTLTFNGTFKNQIAIVRLGEESANTSRLRGSAVIGTNYTLQYNGNEDKFELAVTESADANIFLSSQNADGSYVVLFPNTTPNVELKSNSGKKVTFLNGVKPGSMYTLEWEEYQENVTSYNFVNLGLPSGTLWADRNIGASDWREAGNYYAWGETYTKTEYTESNYSLNAAAIYEDIAGNPQFDAATANWGSKYRMPTYDEFQELFDNCVVVFKNYAYTFTSKINGNYITFIRSGCKQDGSTVDYGSTYNVANYWSSSPYIYLNQIEEKFATAGEFGYFPQTQEIVKLEAPLPRYCGVTIRPVKPRTEIQFHTGYVTNIGKTSAVCEGIIRKSNGLVIKERGFVVSRSQVYPTLEDHDHRYKSYDNSDNYYITMTGLWPTTHYYVRAYLIDEHGVVYYANSWQEFSTFKHDFNFNGYENYVDLGLPSGRLWAKCNIGAENEGSYTYGHYFMWACPGQTAGYGPQYYLTDSYNCNDNYSGNVRYDAATAKYGGDWRTPTMADFEELFEHCKLEYSMWLGYPYLEITGSNGRSIKLPFGGIYKIHGDDETGYNCEFVDEKVYGYYLTADYFIGPDLDDFDDIINCKSAVVWMDEDTPRGGPIVRLRFDGMNIRPVIGPITE